MDAPNTYAFQSEEWLRALEELIYSADLSEATYSIGRDLMEANFDLLEVVFAGCSVWETYSDLFRITERSLDLTQLREDKVTEEQDFISQSGSFMGDGLSFIHLTLTVQSCMLAGLLKAQGLTVKDLPKHFPPPKRPYGAQAGDDLILLNAKYKECEDIDWMFSQCGLEFSKIHSKGNYGTFTEQYCGRLPKDELDDLEESCPDNVFGDIYFTDVIKPSALSGKAKVSDLKQEPCIGHAILVNRYLSRYLPKHLRFREWPAKVLLWSNNYRDFVKLSRAWPSFPSQLGGLDAAIGKDATQHLDQIAKDYIPYWNRMLSLDYPEFLSYQIALKSIFQSPRKGVPWENNLTEIMEIISRCRILTVEELPPPPEGRTLSRIELFGFYKRKGFISAFELNQELERRYALQQFWKDPFAKRNVRAYRLKDSNRRHKEIWEMIRKNLTPLEVPRDLNKYTLSRISSEFFSKGMGFYVSRSDPGIKSFFGVDDLFFETSEDLSDDIEYL
jgi:hypothetical protein